MEQIAFPALLIAAGVAVLISRRRSEGRSDPMPEDEQARIRKSERQAERARGSEDIAYGQYVVVTARWILVASGLILSLWTTETPATQAARDQVLDQMKYQFLALVLLAFGNFYLNLQLLRHRPAVGAVAYLASAADITVITVLVILQHGFQSPLYIFYFPALLAISVAFPGFATLIYTIVTIFLYWSVTFPVREIEDQQALLARIVMFAAVAFCGHLYFRIEHDRRRDAERSRDQLVAALGER